MARFCSNCGAPLPDMGANCPSCNTAPAAGLSDKAAGALAYFTFIPAVIFLVLAPYNRNPFVRFHALQCLLFNVAYVILHAAAVLSFSGFTLSSLIGLLSFILWIVLVVKAYQGETWKLPILGDIAERQARATGP